ncbi:MAG: cyclase family protein [Longimonas sp.]|uniref:cyclase family protein n=1 Tax=Longimonas sp. TaxID=2039626 RepID=UPI0033486825
MNRWIDISQLLDASIAAWPGDVPFSRRDTLQISSGDSVNCSAIDQSAHVGTHADAPYHVNSDGPTTDSWTLGTFIGPAEVVSIPAGTPAVQPGHLVGCETPRILLKTVCSHRSDTSWNDAFPAISLDAVQWMAEQGIQLVGTDAPSVDPADSTGLDAHHALNEAHIVNIENLRLGHVEAGTYSLVALPMPVAGSDAAPVRAVLHADTTLFTG